MTYVTPLELIQSAINLLNKHDDLAAVPMSDVEDAITALSYAHKLLRQRALQSETLITTTLTWSHPVKGEDGHLMGSGGETTEMLAPDQLIDLIANGRRDEDGLDVTSVTIFTATQPQPRPEPEVERLRKAVKLVLALHDAPKGNHPPYYSVNLDPKAEQQLREALAND